MMRPQSFQNAETSTMCTGLRLMLPCWFSRRMTRYLHNLLHPFPPPYMYTDCELQSELWLSAAARLHILSFTALNKQRSQAWWTAGLQGSSGINRFDSCWKRKDLWEGSESLRRRGRLEPRILVYLRSRPREGSCSSVWYTTVCVLSCAIRCIVTVLLDKLNQSRASWLYI